MRNLIGPFGVPYLIRGNWNNLQELSLRKSQSHLEYNKLGIEGCRELTKIKWKKMKILTLCILLYIQIELKLIVQVQSFWQTLDSSLREDDGCKIQNKYFASIYLNYLVLNLFILNAIAQATPICNSQIINDQFCR